jgi:phage terminase large subunit
MPTATAEPRAKRAYRNRISSIPDRTPNVRYIDYEPRGACRDLFLNKDPELIIDGVAGSGKSRACLEKCHWLLEKYPNIRGLMIRKTRKSMTQSCIVTFEQEVLPDPKYVPFHGTDNQYNYPNGSIFAISGLDDPTKIYSSFWDFAYVNQAEELTEDEWTQIGSRLRNFKMVHKGVPWTQLLGDDNPVHPQHWIPARARAIDEATGKHLLTKLDSRHEDNPVYWDLEKGEWTQKGRIYIATLDRLFGVLKKRLRYGLWAAAEGAVYEESFDVATHVIPRFLANTDLRHDQVPKDWPRYWTVDFGYKNPFYWAAWAKDPDGRLFLYKQMYMTGRLVEDHARKILEYTADDPAPKAIICDHDAEDRATLQKHLGTPIPAALLPKEHPFLDKLKTHYVTQPTKGAYKAVSQGIQAVEARLRIAGDGKPRLFYLRDSLVEVDQSLLAEKKPVCSEDEYSVYIWDKSNNKKKGEEPVKENDHGKDGDRYLVAFVDDVGRNAPRMFGMISVTRSGAHDGGGSLTSPSGFRMDGGSGLRSKWSNT